MRRSTSCPHSFKPVLLTPSQAHVLHEAQGQAQFKKVESPDHWKVGDTKVTIIQRLHFNCFICIPCNWLNSNLGYRLPTVISCPNRILLGCYYFAYPVFLILLLCLFQFQKHKQTFNRLYVAGWFYCLSPKSLFFSFLLPSLHKLCPLQQKAGNGQW